MGKQDETPVNSQMVNNSPEIGSECCTSMQSPVRFDMSSGYFSIVQKTIMVISLEPGSSEPAACWEWPGPRTSDGYGRVIKGKRYCRAHRISYELANGPVPASLCVLHRCDNRICVRPSHLFLGTRRDNALDKALKQRVRHSRHGLPFGVARQAAGGPRPYKAQICENGKIKYLGAFATIAEAHAAAVSARESRAARLRMELAEHPTEGENASCSSAT